LQGGEKKDGQRYLFNRALRPLKPPRITKKSDFEQLSKKGERVKNSLFKILFLKNSQTVSRYAIVISKKTEKKAYARNKIRRRVSEILRLNNSHIKPGYDILFILLFPVKEKNYHELEQNLITLLKKSGLLS